MQIGQIIEKLRTENDWSYRDLAIKCSVDHAAVYRIEKGAATPTLQVLERIAGAFGLTASNLIQQAEQLESIPTPLEEAAQ